MTRSFRKDEEGAVTVDWVVLTAAIVGMGVAVMATVKNGTTNVANKISQGLGQVDVEGVD
jgi:Flp pilus assembly pilin Flp